jgi:hypothetical protein
VIVDPAGLAGAVAGFLALPAAWATWRVYTRGESQVSFVETRQHLNGRPERLRELVREAIPNHLYIDGLPVIAKHGWIFTAPKTLESLELILTPSTAASGATRAETRRTRSRRSSSRWSYSAALRREFGKDQLFNGYVYRPLSIATTPTGLLISCSVGRYFDYLDHGEVLAYELANRDIRGRRKPASGLRRRAIKDPFDFSTRPTSLGVNTLTIRNRSGKPTFLMHRRAAAGIVNDYDLVHVTPAGEFTPSSYAYESFARDFSIWRNIQREYAEELLGMDEQAGGQAGSSLNYDEPPFNRLDQARAAGELTVSVLGLVVDPLFLKPELLTVCAFDASLFDEVFASKVQRNNEGTILAGDDGFGIPFTEESVHMYARHPGTTSSGTACLELAWRHRDALDL